MLLELRLVSQSANKQDSYTKAHAKVIAILELVLYKDKDRGCGGGGWAYRVPNYESLDGCIESTSIHFRMLT